MAVWPVGLEQKQFSGLTESRQAGTIRSEMDTGAPKVRKRFTSVVRNVSVPVAFSIAEKATFDTFFNTTLSEGSLSFDWVDPNDDTTTVSYRFTKPVVFRKVGGLFTGNMSLEILP